MLSYVVSGIYINMSFSGLPYISDMHCNQLKIMRQAFVIWGLGRLCSGGTDILFGLFFEGKVQLIYVNAKDSLEFMLQVFYIFLYLFVSEVFPVFKTSDYAFLDM